MDLNDLVLDNRETTTKVTNSAYLKALALWQTVNPGDLVNSWQALLPAASDVVATAQYVAATDSAAFAVSALEWQDLDSTGPATDGRAFAGIMQATGASVDAALAGAAYRTLDAIAAGQMLKSALTTGSAEIARVTQLAVFGASEGAASTVTASRKGMGWVRVAQAGCCPRCSVLAGRFYRWNRGFKRHAHCRCTHVPSAEAVAGSVGQDPYQLFNALAEVDQNRIWTTAGAQALRDGADIYQVANAKFRPQPRGPRKRNARFTREGAGRRGFYRTSTEFGRQNKRRLTVDEIYRRAGGSRTRAIKGLEDYGYIIRGEYTNGSGQVAGGLLRGDREGFGQMGRGGTRVGVREAIEAARRTGQRIPGLPATMTAAELREARLEHYRRLHRTD